MVPPLAGQDWPVNADEDSLRPWDFVFRHINVKKRGGDTSQAPPPSNGIPEIGGSSAGFIALVVVLASIVVICCVAVFFLLRNHKRDPYEQHTRRVLSRKRETNIYEMPLGPPGMRDKFKSLFGLKRKQEGWVRAGSSDDDEWDASDLNPSYGPGTMRGGMEEVRDSPFTPPPRPRMERSPTSDSIELSVPSSQDRSPPVGIDTGSEQRPSFHNPFSGSSPSIESPPSRAVPEHSHFSVPSGSNTGSLREMRKFDGGTKFKEVLDF